MAKLPDHMKYDSQIIVCIVPGGKDANNASKVVYKNAWALSEKRDLAFDTGKTTFISATAHFGPTEYPDLASLQAKLTGNSRVYLVGHGTAESCSLGDLDAKRLAAMLRTMIPAESALKIRRVGLVGCYTGLQKLSPGVDIKHPLAVGLFELVKDIVVDVCGYNGAVHTTRNFVYYDSFKEGTVKYTDASGKVMFVESAKFGKVVAQQVNLGGTPIVARKIVVNESGVTWC